jgi:uncharacterized membrane protein YhaH (DUF805 family)
MFKYYIKCVTSDFANFSGRGRRLEFWGFIIFHIFIITIISLLISETGEVLLILLNGSYLLLTFIPTMSAMIRRIHDTGNSGLLILIPVYGFVLLMAKGIDGTNRYGLDPRNPVVKDELDKIGKE